MPGNYSHNQGDPFRMGAPRKNLWDQLPFGSHGVKRKFSDDDLVLSGPSTSTGIGDGLFSGGKRQRHTAVGEMEPSTSMDCEDNYAPEVTANRSVYPSTLYSHMLPYSGTPPAPQRSSHNRPEFPRAAALSPVFSNSTRDQAAAEIFRQQQQHVPDSVRDCHRPVQTAFCHDHCRAGTQSPNSAFTRCFCRPSWEGMVSPVPIENDYY